LIHRREYQDVEEVEAATASVQASPLASEETEVILGEEEVVVVPL